MILWFGKKKKKEEMKAAGTEMVSPELSAEDLAAKEAAEAEAAKAAAEKEEIERIVAEANKAWEERQAREAEEAAAEAKRLEEEARRAEEAAAAADAEESARLAEEAELARKAREERAAQQAKAEAELKLLADRREAERLRAEAEAAARAAMEAEANNPGFVAKLGQGLSRSSSRLTEGEEEIRLALASEISDVLKPREKIVDFSDGTSPRIVLFVGVNGSGKTTTIGKIASKLKEQGAKALLVAGDTFRAAAIEQLTVWGDRAGIPVMSKPTGADAAGLVYEAIEKAKAEDLDLVLIDTAGRLQNKAELMAELEKVVRVIKKLDPTAPHDVILVLDATVGQNALSQVEAFRNTAGVTGLVMTKMDGTAKGGVLVAIAEAYDLPIHFIGIGEKAEDLRPFSAEAFSKALVGVGA